MHYLKLELLLNHIGSLSLLSTDRLAVGIFQAGTEVEDLFLHRTSGRGSGYSINIALGRPIIFEAW